MMLVIRALLLVPQFAAASFILWGAWVVLPVAA